MNHILRLPFIITLFLAFFSASLAEHSAKAAPELPEEILFSPGNSETYPLSEAGQGPSAPPPEEKKRRRKRTLRSN